MKRNGHFLANIMFTEQEHKCRESSLIYRITLYNVNLMKEDLTGLAREIVVLGTHQASR